jgi:hypothetical protein
MTIEARTNQDWPPNVCVDCHGMLMAGEEMQKSKVTWHLGGGAVQVKFEYRCRQCMEQHCRDLWCEEDQGPCPHLPMQQSRTVC